MTPEQQAALDRHIDEVVARAPRMTLEQAAKLRPLVHDFYFPPPERTPAPTPHRDAQNAGPADRPLYEGHHRLNLQTACVRCDEPIGGWMEFDPKLRCVDTEGFMFFNEGPVCDRCLTRSIP